MNDNTKIIVEVEGIRSEFYARKMSVEEMEYLSENYEDFNVIEYREE